MRRPRVLALICTVLVVLLAGAALRFEGVRAARTTEMTDDEATSVLAAEGILHTGLPRLPTGLIYYRSPMSHYLDAMSTAIVGDNLVGWRGASLLAYALLLIVPALLLIRRGQPLLGPIWVAFMSLTYPLQTVAISARMYMVYTLFATLSVLAAIYWKPLRMRARAQEGNVDRQPRLG